MAVNDKFETAKLVDELVKRRSAEFEADKQRLMAYVTAILGINAALLGIFYGQRALSASTTDFSQFPGILTLLGILCIVGSEALLIFVIFSRREWLALNILKPDPDYIRKDNGQGDDRAFWEIITNLSAADAYVASSKYITYRIINPNQDKINRHFMFFDYACIATIVGVVLLAFSVLIK